MNKHCISKLLCYALPLFMTRYAQKMRKILSKAIWYEFVRCVLPETKIIFIGKIFHSTLQRNTSK